MNNTNDLRKKDGFKNEKMLVIPTEIIASYRSHPLVRSFYITDIGFFPYAVHHYRERTNGANEYILLYCMQGSGTVEINNTHIRLVDHDCLIIAPHIAHRYYSDNINPWSLLWFHIKGEYLQYFNLKQAESKIALNNAQTEQLEQFFIDTLDLSANSISLKKVVITSQKLGAILTTLFLENTQPIDHHQAYYLNRGIHFMTKHLHETLDLKTLSNELFLSESYLNQLFKKSTGYAPITFFLQLKMYHISKMLQISDVHINEIARDFGYSDPYYFSRIFKKIIGVSPKKFRESAITIKKPLLFSEESSDALTNFLNKLC